MEVKGTNGHIEYDAIEVATAVCEEKANTVSCLAPELPQLGCAKPVRLSWRLRVTSPAGGFRPHSRGFQSLRIGENLHKEYYNQQQR